MGSSGEQLGVMKLNDALRRAQSLGLDLVEVAATANPPVCKIIDFGKFRYDISKHTKDKKPASSKLKEIKFRVNIDEHDYLTKIRHGEEFLAQHHDDAGASAGEPPQTKIHCGAQTRRGNGERQRATRRLTAPATAQGFFLPLGEGFGVVPGGGVKGWFSASFCSIRCFRPFAS